jgi:hypothetical protein
MNEKGMYGSSELYEKEKRGMDILKKSSVELHKGVEYCLVGGICV